MAAEPTDAPQTQQQVPSILDRDFVAEAIIRRLDKDPEQAFSIFDEHLKDGWVTWNQLPKQKVQDAISVVIPHAGPKALDLLLTLLDDRLGSKQTRTGGYSITAFTNRRNWSVEVLENDIERFITLLKYTHKALTTVETGPKGRYAENHKGKSVHSLLCSLGTRIVREMGFVSKAAGDNSLAFEYKQSVTRERILAQVETVNQMLFDINSYLESDARKGMTALLDAATPGEQIDILTDIHATRYLPTTVRANALTALPNAIKNFAGDPNELPSARLIAIMKKAWHPLSARNRSSDFPLPSRENAESALRDALHVMDERLSEQPVERAALLTAAYRERSFPMQVAIWFLPILEMVHASILKADTQTGFRLAGDLALKARNDDRPRLFDDFHSKFAGADPAIMANVAWRLIVANPRAEERQELQADRGRAMRVLAESNPKVAFAAYQAAVGELLGRASSSGRETLSEIVRAETALIGGLIPDDAARDKAVSGRAAGIGRARGRAKTA